MLGICFVAFVAGIVNSALGCVLQGDGALCGGGGAGAAENDHPHEVRGERHGAGGAAAAGMISRANDIKSGLQQWLKAKPTSIEAEEGLLPPAWCCSGA